MHAVGVHAVDVTVGLFVGGASSRMGGHAKGLLRRNSEPLLLRGIRLANEIGTPWVLVGDPAPYRELLREVAIDDPVILCDEPPGVGPIGGLAALVAHTSSACVLALAVDMPFVEPEDLEALLDASGPIRAARRDDHWEPLLAVYERSPLLAQAIARRIAAGQHGLQGLLDEIGAVEVTLPPRHLDDWDAPGDVTRSV